MESTIVLILSIIILILLIGLFTLARLLHDTKWMSGAASTLMRRSMEKLTRLQRSQLLVELESTHNTNWKFLEFAEEKLLQQKRPKKKKAKKGSK